MKELKIIATIVAKAENHEAVATAFDALIEGTRKEAGNISYELHRDIKNPLSYVMVEHWASAEAIESHNASDHFQTFVKTVDGMLSNFSAVTIELVK